MNLLTICTTVVFIAACITFISTKLIAARVYIRTIANNEGIESPYGYVRSESDDGDIGYSITKNGKLITLPNSTRYVVYSTLSNVIKEINVLERMGGYKISLSD